MKKSKVYKVIFTETSRTDNSAYCRFIQAQSKEALNRYAESCGMKVVLAEVLNEWETGCILEKVDFLNEHGEMEYHTEP